jgi:peroxiredoxin
MTNSIRTARWLASLSILGLSIAAIYGQSIKTGPDVGQAVPSFSASDQDGRAQTLQSIMGPKGAMLVFFRSADWWPFCKVQLVELQHNLAAIRKEGLGVAAISYDSTGALKSFADRQHISYPLLSDPDSKIIRAFDILNETSKPGTMTYGIPYPGVYILDVKGQVLAKYFEDDYKDRVSTADILARQFGAPIAAARGVSETKHLRITASASNDIARPGLRIALKLDIELKPGMHVDLRAPGLANGHDIVVGVEQGEYADFGDEESRTEPGTGIVGELQVERLQVTPRFPARHSPGDLERSQFASLAAPGFRRKLSRSEDRTGDKLLGHDHSTVSHGDALEIGDDASNSRAT